MIIQRGMSGGVVQHLQERLRDLRLYIGPIDSSFGGGTEAAVKNFQKGEHATVTGMVDPETWKLLFPDQPPPESELSSASVADRCLALTGAFETGAQPPDCYCGISGDFDGQGLSFGVLQWNIGQGSLQPLLTEMFEQQAPICRDIFHEHFDTVSSLGKASLDEQLQFARSLQNRGQLNEPWQGMLKTLGRTPEFRSIQVRHAAGVYQRALQLCGEFGLNSQRAAALLFDILTQNGSISSIVKAQILAGFTQISSTDSAEKEVARMRIVANRRADACRPEFADDVRNRKLTIAEGRGTVHGNSYDLENTFCLTLKSFT